MSGSAKNKQWSFDVFPCPVEYFEIVHEVVDLYQSQPDPNYPTKDVLAQVAYHKNLILSQPMLLERGEQHLHLTEAYRFAIVLYLLRMFNSGSLEEIQWLTSTIFHHAEMTHPYTGCADQMLFPLFNAGLEIRDKERQRWLRDRAAAMQFSSGFRNVEGAMAVLESVWAGTSPGNYVELVASDGISSMLIV